MGGGGEQTTTTETNPWAPTVDAGKDIISMAGDLFQQQGGINGNWIDFNAPGMNENLQGAYDKLAQNEALGNISGQLGGLASGLGSTLEGALDSYKKAQEGYTTYDIQNMRDTLNADKQAVMDKQFAAMNAQSQKAMDKAVGGVYGQAAGGGNVGSSRTQMASGMAASELAAQNQTLQANIASASYDANQTAAMNTLQTQQQNQMAAAQAGFGAAGQAANMYNQQAALEQQMMGNQLQAGLGQYNFDLMQAQMQYQNLMGAQNAGWQNLGMYNQIVGGWAGAGGSATNTASGGGGGAGQSIGAAIGGIGGAFFGAPGLGMSIGGALGGAF